MKIRNASDLKFAVKKAGTQPHFFTRNTMRFFGDRMSNYGLRQPRPVTLHDGRAVNAYELTRRRPVKHGLRASAWFDAETFDRVFPVS
jgi:hypothetical protein